jgi:hypothetical protein
MTIPSRADAAGLLLSLRPPAWHVRHARAVAEVAGWLAARCAASGARLDRGLVEAAGLLHDVDKAIPRADPAAALAHGDGSAAWLAARGHPELGSAVAAHPVSRLLRDDAEAWLARAPLEDLVVAYADKRASHRLGSIDVRFEGWRRRYPGGWSTDEESLARRRAAALERAVCARAGVTPAAVGRLPWTAPALAAARRRGIAVAR